MGVSSLSRVRLLNLREFRRHWGRAIATVGVIAVSAALLVAVIGISGSITGSIERLANSVSGDADLEVSGITDAGFDQALAQEIRRVPGVGAAVPMVRTQAPVANGQVLLLGVDLSASALGSDLQRSIDGQLGGGGILLSVPNAAAVGAGSGYRVGDTITTGSHRLTVVAVVHGAEAERLNGGRFVITTLGTAQAVTDRARLLDSVLVVVAEGTEVATVRSDIARALDGRAVVAAPGLRAAQASGSVMVLGAMALMAASVSLVVAAFLVYNVMSMAIVQRRPTLAMLRALGGKRRMIFGDMLIEAAVLGLVGGVLGSLLGVLIGGVSIGRLPSALVQSLEVQSEYVLPPYAIPLAVIACVVASVAAAALAARRIYAVSPIESLAPVLVSKPEAGGLAARVVAGVLGVAAVAGVVLVVVSDLGRVAMIAIALAFIAGCLLGYAFSVPLVRSAAAIARRFGSPGALAAANIERAPRRVWVTVMTVFTAVATTVSVTGANANGLASVIDSFSSVAETDIFVSATPADVFPTAPILPQDLEQRVAAVPGVEQVIAGQAAFAMVEGTRVMIQGLEAGSHREIYTAMSESARTRMLQGAGVVLSRDVGRGLGVTEGDELALPTPGGIRQVRVLELVPFFSGLTGIIAMNLPQMRDWFARDGSTELEVMVSPGTDRDTVMAAVRSVVPAEYYVFSGTAALEQIGGSLAQITIVIAVMAWIVVLVSAIALLNTLMLATLDRRRELGMLRALGANRRFVLRMILAEAAGIGIVGGAMGMAIGTVNQFMITTTLSDVLSLDVAFEIRPLILAIGVGALAMCLAGSLPPAIRAARLEIVDAVSAD
ncbi:FtsX-like permease family protein [Nocardia sp. CDC159]|uniref:FtsX-like permease family protein n=1 Tax=Nocardia pulmonis TaxID=2951408 RepID=A0A9X2EEG6_9NOCA|nr:MULTISPECIES: FtsX-like permease family protein [Nocardia]MCM6776656.1 FtsX-like permease family protein [Nocardia pulmonis]MCM6789195.1 FtsX-like permease family protein [Nocardia sp. CDC159]